MAYWLAGSVYHRDALWLLHFPPTTLGPMPDNPISAGRHIGLQYLLFIQLFRHARSRLRVDGRCETALSRRAHVGDIRVDVRGPLLLPSLPQDGHRTDGAPFHADTARDRTAAARAVETWLDGAGSSRRLMLISAALVAIWTASQNHTRSRRGADTRGVCLCCVVGATRAGHFAGAAALAAGLGLLLPLGELTTPVYFQPALAWLRAHPDEIRGATIYTNSQVMPFGINTAGVAESDPKFIVGPDIVWELDELTNPANGQQDAIMRLAATKCYGDSVMADAISPDTIAPRSIFVLRRDPRLPLTLPDRVWAAPAGAPRRHGLVHDRAAHLFTEILDLMERRARVPSTAG